MSDLSIVIPVREEVGIGEVLRGIARYREIVREILLIYDDPLDSTLRQAEIANEGLHLPLSACFNRTPGPLGAVLTGFARAGSPYVVVMMGDDHDDPATLPLLLQAAEQSGACVVGASRYTTSFNPQSFQEWFSYLGNRCLCRVKGLPLHDLTNNYRLYLRDWVVRYHPRIRRGWALALDLTLKALEEGRVVVEVPTQARPRRWGKSKFRLLRWLPDYLLLSIRLLRAKLPNHSSL